MRTVLPYAYTETFTWNRKSGHREACKIGHVSADVPEVSSSEMQPFARWIDFGGPSEEDQERICASYAGNLYMQVFDWEDRPVSNLPTGAHARWNREAAYNIINATGISGSKEEKFERALAGEGSANPTWAKLAKKSDQEEKRATAQELVDGLMLVDGQLWHKTAAPRIKCDTFFGDYGRRFIWAPPTTYRRMERWGPLHSVWFFGLSEIDVLRRHESHWAEASYRDLEVFDTEAEPFLGRHELLARTMDMIVGNTDVASLSAAAISDWITMRDAVKQYYCCATGKVAQGSEEAMRNFAEMRLPRELVGEIDTTLLLVDSLEEAVAEAQRRDRFIYSGLSAATEI